MSIQGQIQSGNVFTFAVHNTTIKRLDQYVASQFTDYSRSFFQKLIDLNHILVNSTPATKHGQAIYNNDVITVKFPTIEQQKTEKLTAEPLTIPILAQTDHFMIINKPAHLLVHAPSKTSTALTLTDWILRNHSELAHVGIVDRPGIVHRLDKETSGLLVITRTNYAHEYFGKLFRQRHIAKTYLALVEGHPSQTGSINFAIGRNPHNRVKMAHYNPDMSQHAQPVGTLRAAHTDYTVREYFENAALIEVHPTTGRTHQIRVHMAAIGHPIIGDQLYGKKSSLIDRHALHAHAISFTFENHQHTFTAQLPHDMTDVITALRTEKK